eukprot:jgi/Ulvmu1/6853/UM031_0058.1
MIFIPPIIPPVGWGRFKGQDLVQVKARCTAVNHARPGLTRECGPPPPDNQGFLWSYDHHRVQVGYGKEAFDKAKDAVSKWDHFQLDWARVDPETPVKSDTQVCVESQPVPFLPIWTACPLRIVFNETTTVRLDPEALRQHSRTLGPGAVQPGSARVFRFAHTCLKGHYLAGEERFQVEWHQHDDSVWYDVCAVSRPAHPVAIALFPFVRLCQKRFAYDTLRRMRTQLCPPSPSAAACCDRRSSSASPK